MKNNWNCKLYKSKDILNNIYLYQEIMLNYEPTNSGIQNWTKYIYKKEFLLYVKLEKISVPHGY